ncbi:sorting nexin-13-like isoform X2 [Oppia nitens]|uniref:sorting nexin-13-like isoform X2 n=1 Tax=Oppia nitens TaxID=1686743 RepID=UPI0023D9FD06|nr:sorting nexin-13-like isoform X2 [Oppia nitens]
MSTYDEGIRLVMDCVDSDPHECLTYLYLKSASVESDYQIFKSCHSIEMIDSNNEWTNFLNQLNKDLVVATLPKSDIFTGHQLIDDQLNDVLRLTFRDYINSWYAYISPNQQFTCHLYSIAQMAIKSVTQRLQSMDIVSYMTTKLVDDFASHLRLYRLSQNKLKELKVNDPNANLLSIFFDFEVSMEKNICRDLVSEDVDSCTEYLSQICDILQYLLLPIDSFKNRTFRLLFRGLVVKSVLYPLLEMLSDPDFINQTIVWLYKSYAVSSDTFISVLRLTDKIDELDAVRQMVNHEIAFLRSKDMGGDDDFEIKQQLNSLLFVKDLIECRLKSINEGSFDSDSTDLPTQIDWSQTKLYSLPFEVVLKNNIGLSYFIEFMSSIGAQGYIYFYLNVEGFKVSAEQQISEAELIRLGKSNSHNSIDLDSLKEAAINIYDTYLSEKASHKLKIDETICKTIHSRIMTEKLSENWFDSSLHKVYDIMMNNDNYFSAFKKSNHYIKLLAELDLLKEVNNKQDEEYDRSTKSDDNDSNSLNLDDCDSLNSLEDIAFTSDNISITSEGSAKSNSTSGYNTTNTTTNEEMEITAEIIKTGVVREFGNAYAAYVINVTKRSNRATDEKWVVLRRYSDFYAFHKHLSDKFPNLKGLALPGKRTFNNMNKEFVEQRRHLLNTYLNQLLKTSTIRSDLRESVINFFKPGNYEKEKFQFSKTVQNSIFNPLKTSVINVGNAVKSSSGNFLDGLQKLGRLSSITSINTSQTSQISRSGSFKLNLQNESQNTNQRLESMTPIENSKVSANLDIESEDNIPLRIMLLLMDEVFDLKHKNLWLRRRIVTFLRQIIHMTYGDAINKKIIDYVEDSISPSSVAEYIKAFKNSFWPTGHLAQPIPARSQATKMRTRVAAKMLLLTSVSDDLKRIIGSETSRKGMMCVFEMFQHENLNRRLVLVLFEGILQQLFPDNHFEQVFQKLHSKSNRIPESEKLTSNWPPYLYKFLGIDKSSVKSPSKSPLYRRKKT